MLSTGTLRLVALLALPRHPRPLLITDAGINVAPTLADKRDIVQNAIDLAHALGIELPRVSRDQARVGTPVASLAEAKPGDLVAFGDPVDHIGIYVGDGKFIEAPHTGDVVKISPITRMGKLVRAGRGKLDLFGLE